MIPFTRTSTRDTCYIDPLKVSLVIGLRPDTTRIYLGSEAHYVDVVGDVGFVIDAIVGGGE